MYAANLDPTQLSSSFHLGSYPSRSWRRRKLLPPFAEHSNHTGDAFFVHFQTFIRVWCIHRHHHRCSKENRRTSLLSSPRPLDCAELFGNQQRRRAIFVTVAHTPFEFQIGNVLRFGLLDRHDCRGAFACMIKTQHVGGRLPINID